MGDCRLCQVQKDRLIKVDCFLLCLVSCWHLSHDQGRGQVRWNIDAMVAWSLQSSHGHRNHEIDLIVAWLLQAWSLWSLQFNGVWSLHLMIIN